MTTRLRKPSTIRKGLHSRVVGEREVDLASRRRRQGSDHDLRAGADRLVGGCLSPLAQLLRSSLLEALGIEVDRRVVAEATRQDPVAQVLQSVEPAAAAADQEMEVGALKLAVERLLADLELGRNVELAGAEALGQKQAQHRHRVDLGGELDAVPAPSLTTS